MLIYYRTSILESSAQTVVNTVNCVGVMGKGIAQAFKKKYPEMFTRYKKICDDGLLEPGKLWLWRGQDQWVLNFPTKKHWRHPSRLEWIEAGLRKFLIEYESRGITEISFPRLGCGNGGLDWDNVRPLMERYLSKLPISVFIHDHDKPIGLPEHVETGWDPCDAPSVTGTFEEFTTRLQAIVGQLGGTLADPKCANAVRVAFHIDVGLEFRCGEVSSFIDTDHVRGLWIRLRRGLLTLDAARATAGDSAERAMRLLSRLSEVRRVEVQKPGSASPEVALVLKRSVRDRETDANRQSSLVA